MAPEILNLDLEFAEQDEKIDIYSLGGYESIFSFHFRIFDCNFH